MVGMKGKLAAVVALTALAACGGGGGGGSAVPIAAVGPGFKIANNGVPVPSDLATIEGNTDASGTAILVDDGTERFFSAVSTAIPGGRRYEEGGVVVLRIRPERDDTTTYGFVRYIDMDYSGTDTRGLLANFTSLSDMPTSGSGIGYFGNGTGEAYVWVNGAGTPYFLAGGNVNVTVDFGASKDVDVTVSGLERVTGPTTSDVVTGYAITNMTIDGNKFVADGGTLFSVTTTSGDLDFTGATFDAEGVFASLDDADGNVTASNLPAELGGMVIGRGPDGDTLFGRFAAD